MYRATICSCRFLFFFHKNESLPIKKDINAKINIKIKKDQKNNFFNIFDLFGFRKKIKNNIRIQKKNKITNPMLIEYKKCKNIIIYFIFFFLNTLDDKFQLKKTL